MPSQYGQEAIKKCRELYCKFGGKDFDAIEREMQTAYPKWRRQNLHPRGNKSLGWIVEHNFDKSLEEYLKTQTVAVTDDVQNLYLGIKTVREKLQEKVQTGEGTRDDIYAFRDYAKLEMEARKSLDLSKDNYESFVAIWEKILAWLPEIDEIAATALLSGDVAERLVLRAKSEYGKED